MALLSVETVRLFEQPDGYSRTATTRGGTDTASGGICYVDAASNTPPRGGGKDRGRSVDHATNENAVIGRPIRSRLPPSGRPGYLSRRHRHEIPFHRSASPTTTGELPGKNDCRDFLRYRGTVGRQTPLP